MPILIFFIGVFLIWVLWVKLRPGQADLVLIKFDYEGKRTSFFSKGIVIGAILFWLLLLLVGIACSDAKATVTILGIVSGIYFIFIVNYLRNRKKQSAFQRNTRKVPGKIVGVKREYSRYYNRSKNCLRTICRLYLIVEYQNPDTQKTEEYVTKDPVNGNPFLYLKSLDVTVYYQDAEHIFVGDFKRIKKLTDNIAYQVTGRVDGKDPGVLRYEDIDSKKKSK